MPLPYVPTFSDKQYYVGLEAINERPAFAEMIGRCISSWSYVDNEIEGLFGILLGTESEAAHRVFLVLRRGAYQSKALKAAAEAKLSGNEMALCQKVMADYESLGLQRHTLAHSCFGICPDDDSLLFVIKVEHHVIWQADILPKLTKGIIPADSHEGLKQKMFVYKLSELEELYIRIKQFWFDLFYFNGYLRDRSNSGRQAEFAKLLAGRGLGAAAP
jgi:hypothetical protein